MDGARGNSAAPVSVASGATLEFKGTGYFGVGSASPASGNRGILTLSGNGVGGKGALYNSVGNNVLASGVNSSANAFGLGYSGGLLLLATDTSIGVETGTTLTLSHGITNSAAMSLGGVLSGTAGKLTKVGAGTLIFDANNNTSRAGYAQEIIVNQGTFLVNSPTAASSISGDRSAAYAI